MSKKKSGSESKPPTKNLRRRMTKSMLVALALCIVATSAVVYRHEPLRRTLGLSTAVSPAPQSSGTPSLSKEYIYAGGRLIATEEPSSMPSPTPSSTAPLTFSAFSGVDIYLEWTPPMTGGTVNHYVVERKGSNGVVQLTGTAATTFTDSAPPTNKVYRYRVQAVFTSGVTSDYSNGDIATTIAFDDDPIVPGETFIRAQHINQLRYAVNEAYVIAGGNPITWSVPPPSSGSEIKAEHVQDLWSYLMSARSALGLPLLPGMETAPVKGDIVRASHINAVRAGLK
jgi:hypothetical protein